MSVVTVSKKMKQSKELNSIVEKLETAIKRKDEFAVSILTTRLIGMGYKLEVQGE